MLTPDFQIANNKWTKIYILPYNLLTSLLDNIIMEDEHDLLNTDRYITIEFTKLLASLYSNSDNHELDSENNVQLSPLGAKQVVYWVYHFVTADPQKLRYILYLMRNTNLLKLSLKNLNTAVGLSLVDIQRLEGDVNFHAVRTIAAEIRTVILRKSLEE